MKTEAIKAENYQPLSNTALPRGKHDALFRAWKRLAAGLAVLCAVALGGPAAGQQAGGGTLPEITDIQAGDGSLSVSWQGVPDAGSYGIRWRPAGGDDEEWTTYEGVDPETFDLGLPPSDGEWPLLINGLAYELQVLAFVDGETLFSEPVTGTPGRSSGFGLLDPEGGEDGWALAGAGLLAALLADRLLSDDASSPGGPMRLGAPVVTLVPGDGTIRVEFDEVEGAERYEITYRERGMDPAPPVVVTNDDEDGKDVCPGTTTVCVVIDGLENGTDYDVEVRTIPPEGSGLDDGVTNRTAVPKEPLAPPGQPGTSLDVNGQDIVATWGRIEGATGYELQWSSDDGASWGPEPPQSAGQDDRTYTITGLTHGQTYVVRLRATNNDNPEYEDESSWSAPSDATTVPRKPLTPPGQPETSLAGNGLDIDATWDGGIAGATGYELQWSSDNGASWGPSRSAGRDDEDYTITGLTHGQTYVVRLRATSDNPEYEDESSWSASSAPTTVPLKPLAQPARPGTSLAGNGQDIVATWTGGIPGATGYELQWSSDNGASWGPEQPQSAGQDDRTYTITGLTRGQTYVVRLRATSDNPEYQSTGRWSDPSEATTVSLKPLAKPSAPTTSLAGNGQDIDVTWTGGIKEATGYELQWSSDNGASWGPEEPPSAGQQDVTYTITGLTHGQTYVVRLRATNNDNPEYQPTGRWSDQSGATTIPRKPLTPPGQPETSLAGNGLDIVATWTGGIPGATGYELQWSSDNGASWGPSRSAGRDDEAYTITGLTPGQTYVVQLRATSDNPEYEDESSWSDQSAPTTIPRKKLPEPETRFFEPEAPSAGELPLASVIVTVNTNFTGFASQHKKKTGEQWSESTPRTTSFQENQLSHSRSIADLEPFTEYQLRHRYLNQGGQSIPENTQYENSVTHADDGDWYVIELTTSKGTLAPPSSLSLEGGLQSITVTWDAGGRCDDHKLQHKLTTAGDDAWQDTNVDDKDCTAGNQITKTISGLTAGSAYDVRVAAVVSAAREAQWNNSAPAGPATATVPRKTLMKPAQPGTSLDGNGPDINATWTGGIAGATGYELQWSSDNGKNWGPKEPPSAGKDDQAYKITGLTHGQTYVVRVRATSSESEYQSKGPWSEKSASTTIPRKKLPKPNTTFETQAPSVGELPSATVTVPVNTNFTGFAYQHKKKTGEQWSESTPKTVSFQENQLSFNRSIADLEPFTEYQLRHRYLNQGGQSIPENPEYENSDTHADDGDWYLLELKTGKGKLAKPSELNLVKGYESITVTWKAGSHCDSHRIEHKLGTAGNDAWETTNVAKGCTGGNEITETISDLTGGSEYDVRVVAVSASPAQWDNSDPAAPLKATPDSRSPLPDPNYEVEAKDTPAAGVSRVGATLTVPANKFTGFAYQYKKNGAAWPPSYTSIDFASSVVVSGKTNVDFGLDQNGDDNLDPNTEYDVRVRYLNEVGVTGYEDSYSHPAIDVNDDNQWTEKSVTTNKVKLVAPKDLRLEPGPRSITIRWTGSPNPASYKVEYRPTTNPPGSWQEVKASDLSHPDGSVIRPPSSTEPKFARNLPNLDPGSEYEVRMTAIAAMDSIWLDSAVAGPVTATPEEALLAPEISLEPMKAGKIKVTWPGVTQPIGSNAANLFSYRVEYMRPGWDICQFESGNGDITGAECWLADIPKQDGTNSHLVYDATKTTYEHTITDRRWGYEHHVRVMAVSSYSGIHNSDYSATKKATPLPEQLQKPKSLALTAGQRSINVSWTVNGENYHPDSHMIEYKTADGDWSSASELPAPGGANNAKLAMEITGLTPGTEYDVRVRAVNLDRVYLTDSDWTDSVKATPLMGKLVLPEGFEFGLNPHGKPGAPGIKVDWRPDTLENVEIQWRIGEGDWSTCHPNCDTKKEDLDVFGESRTYDITGLQASTTYTVRMRHRGEDTTDAPSDWSNLESAKPGITPEKLATVADAGWFWTAAMMDDGSGTLVEVANKAVAELGASVANADGYTIRYREAGSSGSWKEVTTAICTPSGSPAKCELTMVGNLTGGVRYEAQIRANPAQGSAVHVPGEWSAKKEAATKGTLPEPRGVREENKKDCILLSWAPIPLRNDRDLKYLIRVEDATTLPPGQTAPNGTWTVDIDQTSVNLTHLEDTATTALTAGTEYWVDIRIISSTYSTDFPDSRWRYGGGSTLTNDDADGTCAGGNAPIPPPDGDATLSLLVQGFDDLELANGGSVTLDMSDHFIGEDLSFEVMVTTADKQTGQVSTGPINTVAADKLQGTWSGDELTLVAGASGHHVLDIRIVATLPQGGSAEGTFQLTVGTPPALSSAAARMLKGALAGHARSLLEDASSAIGGRMALGGGVDAPTALAGLLGVPEPGSCTSSDSFEDCVRQGGSVFGAVPHPTDRSLRNRRGAAGDMASLRDLVRTRGFAMSLDQPLPSPGAGTEDGAASDIQVSLWGQGGASAGAGDGTLFWGLDAASGERWMAGVAFSENAPSAQDSSGLSLGGLTAVHPYARGRLAPGLELWSLAGWGSGHVNGALADSSLSEAAANLDISGALSFAMGLFGAEQELWSRDGAELSLLGDAGWSRLAVTDGRAAGVSATVTRARLGLRGGHVSQYGTWSSDFRVSARADGGDGATASGMEMSGALRHVRGRRETGLEGLWHGGGQASTIAAGVRATFDLRPRGDGTGLALALSPGWGTVTSETEDSLLPERRRKGAAGAGGVVHAGISWGTRMAGPVSGWSGMLRPYADLSLGETAGHVRAGVSFEGPAAVNLAVEHREGDSASSESGVMLLFGLQF